MGALATFLSKLASDNGVELDADELAQLDQLGQSGPRPIEPSDILSIPLPGRAAGEIELYMSEELSTVTQKPAETEDGTKLMWYPIIRSGQWAVRPGTQGRKRKVPLKVVEGHSKNQRREIGLADLKDSFDDEAIQHVTVPTSHNNSTLENTGFIRAMKIVDGQVKDKKTKTDVKCKVLMGGYDFTEPDVKGKVERGTIANRSAGILYDYVNTETGKSYPAVIEHVALTNKPWITGMVSFGRPLSEGGIETVGLSLSDEAPYSDEEFAEVLQLSISEEDRDFLAVSGVAWDHETSPSWLQTQVTQLLDEARAEKRRKQRAANKSDTLIYEDSPPYYRCREAKPGSALIVDGWGDDANAWIAGITVKDGTVELDEFSKWQAVAKVYMPDERDAPPKNKEPLDQGRNGNTAPEPVVLSRLELAQQMRRDRAHPAGSEPNNDNNPPRGGGTMAGESGAAHLSEDAQRLIQEAEARARAAEDGLKLANTRIERLTGTVQSGSVKEYLGWLRSDDGLGLTEERGFGGFLTEVEKLMLADDGEPAVQSEHFAADGNAGGELSLSESIKRLFSALHKSTEGKKRLGEVLSQPADPAAGEEFELDDQGNPKLDAEGKKIPKVVNAADETAGKPPAGDGKDEGTQLSTEERMARIASSSPGIAATIGGVPKPEPAAAGAAKGGDS